MNRIILKPGEEDRNLRGHPWVYDNEIAEDIAGSTPGECADIESHDKKYIGRAFINPHSKIRARIFSHSKEGVDKGFFKRRIREAIKRREDFYDLKHESARLVFGEADFLPGLVVDKFTGRGGESAAASWLSVQFLTAAMDIRRDEIVEALIDVMDSSFGGAPAGIMERGEAGVRKLEGLPRRSGVIYGSVPENGIVINENGIPLFVDLAAGQKTGHFLDQKKNRATAAAFAGGERCLDACCHTGAFALHAAKAGAEKILAFDVSPRALSMVKRNAELNSVQDKIETAAGDIFDILRGLERGNERFGWIVLDPPAFAKSASSLEGAIRGYKEINLRALNLLKKGGVLISCSCSAALREEAFKQIIAS
ncbi:MAG: class I SAM-dependent rRNA methyltransferase, partial [Spirochaetia bacterium]|nr:class I SAM-dependent rRNA methyltransferase [Spirochaetia bacterium]